MSDVKWIKLYTDMFDNSKIKQIRSMAGGNDIVMIWVMLLVLAGKCNAGGMIVLMDKVPYTVSMLAAELGFPEATISMAINTLIAFEMVSKVDTKLSISNWNEYQNADKMDAIREQNRIRKQRERERKRLNSNENQDSEETESMSRDSHVTPSRFCSSSFSLNSNITNLEYILNIKSDYKYKDYINNNSILLNIIREWMQYKDEKTAAKKKNHYDTERGLKAAVSEIVNADKKYGTDEVVKTINDSIVHNWDGLYWEKAEERKAKKSLPEKRPVSQRQEEQLVGLWKDEWDNEDENAV